MDDGDFRDLQERAALIEEMAESSAWTLLNDRARATIFQHQERVLMGRCPSLEDYKAACSWVDGALFVLGLPSRVSSELQAEILIRLETELEDEPDPEQEDD